MNLAILPPKFVTLGQICTVTYHFPSIDCHIVYVMRAMFTKHLAKYIIVPSGTYISLIYAHIVESG